MVDPLMRYEPTDDENRAIDRAAVEAAWRELQPLKDDGLVFSEKIRACLKAFVEVKAAVRRGKELLKKAHPEANYVACTTDVTSVVCSVFMEMEARGGPDKIRAFTFLGCRAMALIKAVMAMEAMSDARLAIMSDEGDGASAHVASETLMLADRYLLDDR